MIETRICKGKTSCRWIAIILLASFTWCMVSPLSAQSESGYSIAWTGRYPGEEKGAGPSFGDRLSGLIFGKRPDRLVRPFGVVASGPGQYHILDQGSGMVMVCKEGRGEFLKSMRKHENRFPSLVGICQLPGGELLVTDSQLERVFLVDGESIKSLPGSLIFTQPTGIAFNNTTGEIWVAETGAHRIQVVSRSGELVGTIGSRGSDPGAFNFPTFIWIDREGRAYIVDSMNFRIQVFDARGQYLFSFGEPGDGTGSMARPKGIATDSDGNIYVADALFHVVQVFDPSGRYLDNFGGQGQGAGEFWMPAGIFIDGGDRIYVADSYNQRIQVFQRIKN
jgi:sugar lactone lactonase YvrE